MGLGQGVTDWSAGGATGIGPGGTAGFAPGSLGLSGGGGRSAGGGLGGLFGGLTGSLHNIRNLGSQFGIGTTHKTDAMGSDVMGTSFGGVLRSPGARMGEMAGGMALATAGLLGSRRGTWGGVAEGAAGGALIGTSILPGIGTLIGAGVGALIGVGEMIAGVESPEHEAIRLVKSIYNVNINTAMGSSIVNVAKSQYGGQVSLAVRSPEVRQMLGLYAAGTNQRMAQSADTPHGAGLVESGGALSQSQMYQYGVGNTYASNREGSRSGNLGAQWKHRAPR